MWARFAMELCARRVCATLLLIAAIGGLSCLCRAQALPAFTLPPSPSRVDVFAGYAYLHPFNSDIDNQPYTTLNGGGIGGVTGYFNRSFGIGAEYAMFPNQPDYCFSTIQAGPAFRINLGRLVPFAHLLGGAAQVGPSYAHNGSSNPCAWGWGGSVGVGVDYILPGFHDRVAIRPIAGDFQFTDVNFGAQSSQGGFSGGVGQIFGARLSAGLVIRLGGTGDERHSAPASLAARGVDTLPPPPGPQMLSANYVIGADDLIKVEVWQEPNISATLPVRPDGNISLPLVGDVPAAGFTPMQLAADLTNRLKKFVTDPVVNVTVQQFSSNRIFIVGEVGSPGPLALAPGMTVLQAIAAAGGPTDYANRKKIHILRGEPGKQQQIPFDYARAVKTGDMQHVSLLPGDTIVVP